MKALVVQPTINPPGGGELVAAWLLEALRDEHDLTLLAWEPPRLDDCNRHFGTSLRVGDFSVRLLAPPLGAAFRRLPLRIQRLKDALLTRKCLQLAPRFDLVVTANNEMNLGGGGVQYLHFPQPKRFALGHQLEGEARPSLPVRIYFALCEGIAPEPLDRIRSNITLVNSDYIGRQTREVHPVTTRTVYPPVPGVYPDVPWADRDEAVIAVGRLAPEKRFEQIVETIAAVRAAGHPLRLTIAAFAGERKYATRIRRLVALHGEFVSLHEGLSKRALEEFIVRHRYGMHAMPDEHFGIAVAEMVRAGCVVFVPKGAGPAEIVGSEPRLLFTTAAEAAGRLCDVLAQDALREELRRHLATRAPLFSAERFVASVREVVREAAVARHSRANVPPTG